MGREKYRDIAATIVDLFPTEQATTYFTVANDKQHSYRGKLVDKFHNFLKKIRKMHRKINE
jgi:hypothetical protein